MHLYSFFSKLHERWIYFHTKMAGAAMGAYGGGGRIEYPVVSNDLKRVFLGRQVVICAGAMLSCVSSRGGRDDYDGEIHIGDGVHIRENVQIAAATKLTIGNCVSIARNCLIADHTHLLELHNVRLEEGGLTDPRPIVIEDGCVIGSYSMIGPGVRLGHHSGVGFGSVVTKSMPPYSKVYGSPARVIARYDHETQQWVPCRRRR